MQTGQEFTFVAPGGQTDDPLRPAGEPRRRGRCPGRACSARARRSGWRTTRARSSCSTSGARGAARAATEVPDLQFVAQQTAATGCRCSVSTCADDRAAAADFVRDRGLTYDSVFDPPGRTLAALRGYPRNTVPSTIVLDRQHRVAAVYLTPIRGRRADPAGAAPGRRAAPNARAGRDTRDGRAGEPCRAFAPGTAAESAVGGGRRRGPRGGGS